jgi:ADP-ribose pyrophosphatase YjhB (NUDIX family)
VPSPPFKDFLRPDYLGVFGLLEEPQGILLVANRRVLGGRPQVVWDLPGGGVEARETLEEALRREMIEETSLEVSVHEMLFVAEGERIREGSRTGVWRSFFFRIEWEKGEIDISREPDLVDYRFVPRSEIVPLLTAPYHRGFVLWLASGGELRHAFDRWID